MKIGLIIHSIYLKDINKSTCDHFWIVNQSITINQINLANKRKHNHKLIKGNVINQINIDLYTNSSP